MQCNTREKQRVGSRLREQPGWQCGNAPSSRIDCGSACLASCQVHAHRIHALGVPPAAILICGANRARSSRVLLSMGSSKTIRKRTASRVAPDLAATLAPEDIRPGAYIAIARMSCEYPSFLWCDSSFLPADQPVRIEWFPPDAGTPLRVEAVCLPFVLVKSPTGDHQTLDARRVRLVRLSDAYGRRAWKRLKKKTTPHEAC